MTSRLAGALVAAALAAACASAGTDPPGTGRIRGRLRADRLPPDAAIEIYRETDDGPAVPVAGVEARPDAAGAFVTPPLVPGRYVVVLRTKENPPSTSRTRVPQVVEVDLRTTSPSAGATVTLVAPANAPGTRTCRLAPAVCDGPVPDRREVAIAPGQEVRLAGLAPGIWHVDVEPDGATADFEVLAGDVVPRFAIDPPAFPASGATLEGDVVRASGEPAYGSAVTARACSPDGAVVSPWGRVARVAKDGSYRIDRMPPGLAFVRVEPREAAFTSLPRAELVPISPPAPALRGFVIQR